MAAEDSVWGAQVPEETADALREYRDRHGLSKSETVRELLERAVDTKPWHHNLGVTLNYASYQVFAMAVLVFAGSVVWPAASVMNGLLMAAVISLMGAACLLLAVYLVEDQEDIR